MLDPSISRTYVSFPRLKVGLEATGSLLCDAWTGTFRRTQGLHIRRTRVSKQKIVSSCQCVIVRANIDFGICSFA